MFTNSGQSRPPIEPDRRSARCSRTVDNQGLLTNLTGDLRGVHGQCSRLVDNQFKDPDGNAVPSRHVNEPGVTSARCSRTVDNQSRPATATLKT